MESKAQAIWAALPVLLHHQPTALGAMDVDTVENVHVISNLADIEAELNSRVLFTKGPNDGYYYVGDSHPPRS